MGGDSQARRTLVRQAVAMLTAEAKMESAMDDFIAGEMDMTDSSVISPCRHGGLQQTLNPWGVASPLLHEASINALPTCRGRKN